MHDALAKLPTLYGDGQIYVYKDSTDSTKEHAALVFGDVNGAEGALIRIHSECMTSEILGSVTCDCREQLHAALQQIADSGCGALLYLRQEGRGIGLAEKVKAYAVQQEQGLDTHDANIAIGADADEREYDVALSILSDLNPKSIRLLTNNPDKVAAVRNAGYQVDKAPLVPQVGDLAQEYREVKEHKFGHSSDKDSDKS